MPLKHTFKNYAPRILLIALFIGWTIFIYQISPTSLIEKIGVSNGYLIIFILSILGGLTMFSGIPYHLILLTFAVGGLHPLLLGIAAGIGVIIGDSTSYLIGYHSKDILPTHLQRMLEKLCSWCLATRHSWVIPIILFLYGSLIPLSNDFLVISLGMAQYPYWKLMIPLGLGNIIFNTGLAIVGAYWLPLLLPS